MRNQTIWMEDEKNTTAAQVREEAQPRNVERFGKCWRDFRTWFHHHDTGTSPVHSINYHAIKKNREKVENEL